MVRGSAEWLNGDGDPVCGLPWQQTTSATHRNYGPIFTPTLSEMASSIYSEPGLDRIQTAPRSLEASIYSHEELAEGISTLSCQTQVGPCHSNANDADEEECSSFKEGLRPNVLVRLYECFFLLYQIHLLTRIGHGTPSI